MSRLGHSIQSFTEAWTELAADPCSRPGNWHDRSRYTSNPISAVTLTSWGEALGLGRQPVQGRVFPFAPCSLNRSCLHRKYMEGGIALATGRGTICLRHFVISCSRVLAFLLANN